MRYVLVLGACRSSKGKQVESRDPSEPYQFLPIQSGCENYPMNIGYASSKCLSLISSLFSPPLGFTCVISRECVGPLRDELTHYQFSTHTATNKNLIKSDKDTPMNLAPRSVGKTIPKTR